MTGQVVRKGWDLCGISWGYSLIIVAGNFDHNRTTFLRLSFYINVDLDTLGQIRWDWRFLVVDDSAMTLLSIQTVWNLLDLTLSDGSMFYQVRYNLASTRDRIFSRASLYWRANPTPTISINRYRTSHLTPKHHDRSSWMICHEADRITLASYCIILTWLQPTSCKFIDAGVCAF